MFFNTILTAATQPTTDSGFSLLEKITDKTSDSGVLIFIIIAAVILTALPFYLGNKKSERKSDIEEKGLFIDVIKNNTDAITSLRTMMTMNNNTLEASLQSIEETSRTTNLNMATNISHQMQANNTINRLLALVDELMRNVEGGSKVAEEIKTAQQHYIENQSKILDIMEKHGSQIDALQTDVNTQGEVVNEIQTLLQSQNESLNTIISSIDKVNKKIPAKKTAAKKATTKE